MIPPFRLTALAVVVAVAAPAAMQSTQSAKQPLFSTPANWDDFQDSPDKEKRAQFRQAWSDNIERWTQYGIVGNPWTGKNDDQRTGYANPAVMPVPEGAVTVLTKWPAFPHRLSDYGERNTPAYNRTEILQAADYGFTFTGRGMPRIPKDAFAFRSPLNQPWSWGPPRGWCDEYCEWSVHRSGETIDYIDFTCENPEYWTTLWDVDRELMRSKIQELVQYPVSLEDLYLRDSTGATVIDVATGLPAYDPLNKWNNGTHSSSLGGGAIHLTSPPNSLGAEIYLAAAATIARSEDGGKHDVLAAHDLIACSIYGGVGRNSDPHIGQNVNQVARLGYYVTLKNPVGLYIQEPDFSRFRLPADKVSGGITIKDCWHLVRGHGPDYGLHARFQVPEGQNFEINDITVDGVPIQYAGQIAQAFDIGIHAQGFPGPDGPFQVVPRECVWRQKKDGPEFPPGSTPQPAQPILGEAVFHMQSQARPQLAFAPPQIPQGTPKAAGYSLPFSFSKLKPQDVVVVFYHESADQPSQKVTAQVEPTLAVDQFEGVALRLTLSVAKDAPVGNYSAVIGKPNQIGSITPAPGMLEVVAAK